MKLTSNGIFQCSFIVIFQLNFQRLLSSTWVASPASFREFTIFLFLSFISFFPSFFFEQFNVSVQFCFRHNIAKWSLFLLISVTDKIWFGVEITAGQRPNFSFCSSGILYYYRNSFFFWTTATEFVRGTLKPLANASFL